MIMLDYCCTKKQGVINVCVGGQGLTKKYFNTLINNAKYMSHAEKCLICTGSGKVTTETLKPTKKVPKGNCYGCEGKGWVTIHDKNEYYPYWYYFPQPFYPHDQFPPIWQNPVTFTSGSHTAGTIDPNSSGVDPTAQGDWSLTANSGNIAGDIPWIDFHVGDATTTATGTGTNFTLDDTSLGNSFTVRFGGTTSTGNTDYDFTSGGWFNDEEKKKGK